MPSFRSNSQTKLKECDERLQRIANLAIQFCNFSIVEAYRNKEEQQRDFVTGKSKLNYPESMHNRTPSMAFDFVPYPFDYNNINEKADAKVREIQLARIYYIAGILCGVAHAIGIPARTGADFNSDGDVSNEHFRDAFHFELLDTSGAI